DAAFPSGFNSGSDTQTCASVGTTIDWRGRHEFQSRPRPSTATIMTEWIVVGAGFTGATLAERIARVRGERVTILERRNHIGGNAHDALDANGIRVHTYGPHIFHTNAPRIAEYLSAFTRWRPYEHRTLAM